jgi:hypothetical protein
LREGRRGQQPGGEQCSSGEGYFFYHIVQAPSYSVAALVAFRAHKDVNRA